MTTEMATESIPCIERDGGRMPVIGLGTFQSSGKSCREAVAMGLELGYRHIDTARMYENEDEVGAGIREAGVPREELFVTTKLQSGQLDPAGVRRSCDKSLGLLDLDYVDLLLIHWPEDTVPLEETLGALAELKQAGKIRHLGVSNFTVAWLEKAVAATDEPIFCNQIEYHPFIEQGPPMHFHREHDMATVAYSPLARGRVVTDDTCSGIGEKYNKTAAQVALRWLVRQSGVAAIPKGSSKQHLRQNLDIFDFDLDEDDLAAIGDLEHNTRLIDPEDGPEWDT